MTSVNNVKIDRKMTIDDILSLYPQKSERIALAMTKAGLHCAGCHAATWETLEMGMRGHGMSEEAINRLVQQLNEIIEEEVDLTTISLTQRAAEKYRLFLEEENKQGWGLRFSEKKAGCSGYEYVLDFSEKSESDDTVIVSQGISIHVKTEQLPRLLGSEIDYIEGLQNAGFKISNPNVRKACGCGSSHGY